MNARVHPEDEVTHAPHYFMTPAPVESEGIHREPTTFGGLTMDRREMGVDTSQMGSPPVNDMAHMCPPGEDLLLRCYRTYLTSH